ncbi:MAG: hypothetical protein IKT98_00015 [Selenomonadaceae bacterium]|nr:hypothetical protein [Selenomonadaceae bacterium]
MKKQLVEMFSHNLLKKLIALIVAFIMWVLVMADQDPAINGSYTVPLTISNAPYEMIAVCDEKVIKIETRAPRSYFVKYDANAFRVYANLDGLEEGNHKIMPQVVMPQGFELLGTFPEKVDVKLDPLIELQMPLELTISGSIDPNSAIKGISQSMEFVTVVGPKSFVEQTAKIYGNVNLTGNTSSFEMQIPMRAVDDKGNIIPNVRVVPSVVTVSIDIENGIKKKIVPVIPELTAPEGWELTKINVEPAQIEISGSESIVNSIVTIKTEPFAVQTGQRIFKGTLGLVVPEGVLTKFSEVTVSAEVIRKPVMRGE